MPRISKSSYAEIYVDSIAMHCLIPFSLQLFTEPRKHSKHSEEHMCPICVNIQIIYIYTAVIERSGRQHRSRAIDDLRQAREELGEF
jgi:hypothetical protein